mmetsp:Transcript_51309/g.133284  ORF Transcript_51309/g.133284 Transcript_51309/m.133284 type:complete len:413 (-) Transcript_51309:447-1685(-)
MAGGGIPAGDGLEALGLLVVVLAKSHVLERLRVCVDERIEEAERRLPLGEQLCIQPSEDGCDNWARGGRARDALPAADVDAVGRLLAAEGGHVRVAAPRIIVQRGIRELAGRCEVRLVLGDGVLLIIRNGEGVGEAATARLPGLLLADHVACKVGGADGRVVRRAAREIRLEAFLVAEATALAPTDALIPRCKQDRQPKSARLHEGGVDRLHVGGARLLRLIVTIGHRVHERRVVEVQHAVSPVEERISRRVDDRQVDAGAHAANVLDVELTLDTGSLDIATDNLRDLHRRVARLRECGQIFIVKVLELELGDRHRARHRRRVVDIDLVALADDGWCDKATALLRSASVRPIAFAHWCRLNHRRRGDLCVERCGAHARELQQVDHLHVIDEGEGQGVAGQSAQNASAGLLAV